MNPILIPNIRRQNSGKPNFRQLAILGGALFVLAGAFTSCNATRGLGQDVKETGEGIKRAVGGR